MKPTSRVEDTNYRASSLGRVNPHGTRLCFQFLGHLLHPDISCNFFLSLWIRSCFFFFFLKFLNLISQDYSPHSQPDYILSFIGASVVTQVVNVPAMQETWVSSLGWKRSPEERHGNPLGYFCLKNLIDRGAWRAAVHGVAKSQTRLSTHA